MPMPTCVAIGNRLIGPGHSVYMIAEMSGNHRQSFEQAAAIVRAAKAAGADAIKLQTATPDGLTIDASGPEFRIGGGTVWDGRRLYDLYREVCMPWEWQPELKQIADGLGLDCFSTPFEPAAVDFLEKMNVPAYKIASFEVVDLPLLRCVAKTGKPVIMSIGMATLAEIEEAVETIRGEGNQRIVLLKCTSAYPAPAAEANLRTIPHLAQTFGVPTGLSDHTTGIAVPLAAVSLGAHIIEKHFTLNRLDDGPDAAFSIEPHEFRTMVESVRETEQALGTVNYHATQKERGNRVLRRSLYVVQNIRVGERLTEQNVRSIRPGLGLAPKHLEFVLGCRATQDLARGTPLTWNLITSDMERPL